MNDGWTTYAPIQWTFGENWILKFCNVFFQNSKIMENCYTKTRFLPSLMAQ